MRCARATHAAFQNRCWLPLYDRFVAGDPLPNAAGSALGAISYPEYHVFDDPTMGCAVLKNLPVEVLRDVPFKHPETNALVKEFWYIDQGPDRGSIRLDAPNRRQEPQWRYAKLITKSSHYDELGQAFLGTAVKVSAMVSQIQLALQWLAEITGVAEILRMLFILFVFVKLVAMLCLGLDRTWKRFEADPGDFVRQSARRDYFRRVLFATFFNMFNVSTDLTDIPILAHVRKPFQPFAVFRSSDAIRAWMVGWLSRSQHEVESQHYRCGNLVLSMCVDAPLLILKVWILRRGRWSVSLVLTIFWSALNMAVNVYSFAKMNHYRRSYKKTMREETRRLLAEYGGLLRQQADEVQEDGGVVLAGRAGLLLARLKTIYKNLHDLFGETIPDGEQIQQRAAQEHQIQQQAAQTVEEEEEEEEEEEQEHQEHQEHQGEEEDEVLPVPADEPANAQEAEADGHAGGAAVVPAMPAAEGVEERLQPETADRQWAVQAGGGDQAEAVEPASPQNAEADGQAGGAACAQTDQERTVHAGGIDQTAVVELVSVPAAATSEAAGDVAGERARACRTTASFAAAARAVVAVRRVQMTRDTTIPTEECPMEAVQRHFEEGASIDPVLLAEVQAATLAGPAAVAGGSGRRRRRRRRTPERRRAAAEWRRAAAAPAAANGSAVTGSAASPLLQ